MPPAATAAARNRADRVERPDHPERADRAPRRTAGVSGPARPAPRGPRRVSGPANPVPAPRGPRRVSGPANSVPAPARRQPAPPPPSPRRQPAPPPPAPRRQPAPRQPAPRPAAPGRSRAPRPRVGLPRPSSPLALLRGLADHRLLDRLIRGRAWIPVLGVLLAGIVATRVEVLKLGVSVGRSVALVSQLQGENQILRANVASLSDDARIERLAGSMGMSMPGPLDVQFVPASGAKDLGRAVAGIASPDPATFESALAAETAANSESIGAVAPPVTSDAPATTAAIASASTTTG